LSDIIQDVKFYISGTDADINH